MEYKRLTNNNLDEYNPEYDFCIGCEHFGEPNGCNRPNGTCGNYERFMETYNRLAEIEDKIEQGTLIELPCKVGQDIYYITDKRKIVHRIAREYRYLVDLGWEITATLWETKRTGELCLRTSIIHSEEIGKAAFFTREEAEKRLKEIQG